MSNIEGITGQSKTFQTCQAEFDAPDVDLLLECTGRRSDIDPNPNGDKKYVFRVHRQRLAAVSTFFEDMMACSSEQNSDSELPEVCMSEQWPLVYIILGYAYNKPDVISVLKAGKAWSVTLKVYEAANKYQIHSLKPLTSSLLRLSVQDIDENAALEIYGRASIFEDDELGVAMLPKAATIGLHHIPRAVLHDLSTSSLAALINFHTAGISNVLTEVNGYIESLPQDEIKSCIRCIDSFCSRSSSMEARSIGDLHCAIVRTSGFAMTQATMLE